MQKHGDSFTIIYKNQDINVQPCTHLGRTLYQVSLPNKQLYITKSEKMSGKDFWTSMPQGEQKLAEVLGALIDDKTETKQTTLF